MAHGIACGAQQCCAKGLPCRFGRLPLQPARQASNAPTSVRKVVKRPGTPYRSPLRPRPARPRVALRNHRFFPRTRHVCRSSGAPRRKPVAASTATMPIGAASHGDPPIGANRPSPTVMLSVAASADAGATTSKLMSAEHVYIESDVSEIPDPRKVRNVQASLRLLSRWRGCHYDARYLRETVSRDMQQAPESLTQALRCSICGSSTRHQSAGGTFPWKCLQTTAGLMLLSVGAGWWMKRSALPFSENPWLPAWALIVSRDGVHRPAVDSTA